MESEYIADLRSFSYRKILQKRPVEHKNCSVRCRFRVVTDLTRTVCRHTCLEDLSKLFVECYG